LLAARKKNWHLPLAMVDAQAASPPGPEPTMTEVKVITLHLDPATGLFDDGPLRGFLADREPVQAVPAFFVHDGRPTWSVFLQTRTLQGAPPAARGTEPSKPQRRPQGQPGADRARRDGERKAFAALLAELDEDQRARYERLRSWRHDAARRGGVPPYVVLTNAQALEVARIRPRTLAALAAVHGIGDKRVRRHGKAILEVLGVTDGEGGAQGRGPVRAVDGPDAVAAGADGAVPQAPSA